MRCYILVGGESRRMGQPKAQLPFGGSTFFDRVVDAALPVAEEVVAVQRHDGPAGPRVRTIFEPLRPERAPVFGVLRALGDAGERCLIVAVDYPLLTTAALQMLIAAVQRSPRPLVVPNWHGRPQMLCAGYDPSLLSLIEARVAGGRYDLGGLLREAGAEMIAETELRARLRGEPLMNVNTPEELEEAREHDERP
jgi:molybdopterin-guanine dinucleotide biosynthesis protein A